MPIESGLPLVQFQCINVSLSPHCPYLVHPSCHFWNGMFWYHVPVWVGTGSKNVGLLHLVLIWVGLQIHPGSQEPPKQLAHSSFGQNLLHIWLYSYYMMTSCLPLHRWDSLQCFGSCGSVSFTGSVIAISPCSLNLILSLFCSSVSI